MPYSVNRFTEMKPVGPQRNGTPGGPSQVGDAWSRRFARKLLDGTFHVVMLDFYVLDTNQEDDRPERLTLVRAVETVICPDPNELDHDVIYNDGRDADLPFEGTPTEGDAFTACAKVTVQDIEIEFGDRKLALRAAAEKVQNLEQARDLAEKMLRTVRVELGAAKTQRAGLITAALDTATTRRTASPAAPVPEDGPLSANQIATLAGVNLSTVTRLKARTS